MTEIARPRRYRRTAPTLSALGQLAREAAEAGEPLAAIAARLGIPPTTLSDWARADGFRRKDVKARAAAAAAAETEANRVRREAEEGLRSLGALLDAAGLIPEAEADMRGARRLLSLMNFAALLTGLASGEGERVINFKFSATSDADPTEATWAEGEININSTTKAEGIAEQVCIPSPPLEFQVDGPMTLKVEWKEKKESDWIVLVEKKVEIDS